MKAPLEWIKEFTNINVSAKEFADRMTLSGSKTEGIMDPGSGLQSVVVGQIQSVQDHPDSDHLHVLSVNAGGEALQIVCGAPNVSVGMKCPVALLGAVLPGGFEIKKAKLRGIESFGMCCSVQELGLDPKDYRNADSDGLWALEDTAVIGTPITSYLGFEGEVIEFEITSNRPDCFSIEGLAREAAVTFDAPFSPILPIVREESERFSGDIARITIDAPELCYRYCSRVIENVRVETSPSWMQNRLRAVGIRPINNIVDITNYVCIEMGQPMHAFDLEYLSGNHIIVRSAEQNEKTVTLDGIQRELNPSILVIADEDKVCAIAGVMGGENSEVKETTGTVLFESATFNPISVRKTAMAVGLRTEASSRYEKGLDPENALRALDRACELVEKLGCGVVTQGVIDVYPNRRPTARIIFDAGKINVLLGTNLDEQFMRSKLLAIGCSFEAEDGKSICIAPSYRPDLECIADLAEEVARFYDYNNIVPTLSGGRQTTVGGRNFDQRMLEKIKDTMVAQGFYEAITYSFESPKECDRLLLASDDPIRNQLVISNPLGEEFSVMRSSTLPSMLRIAGRNASRSVTEGAVFEIAFIYLPSDSAKELPTEQRLLSAILFDANSDPSDPGLFFRMKGVVETLFSHLNITDPEYIRSEGRPYLHPGRSADIVLQGQTIGYIGFIHPEVAKLFEAPIESVVVVIETDPLVKNASNDITCVPLPKYPVISRDLAFIVNRDVPVGLMESLIRSNAGEFLESCRLFDVYSGKQIDDASKSVAFNLNFRSSERTLTDSDINESVDRIIQALSKELGAQLR